MKHHPFALSTRILALFAACHLGAVATPPSSDLTSADPDWLVDPSPYQAQIREDGRRQELVLENGLVRRAIRIAPNAATVDYRNLVTGEQLLRAVGPEAGVTLNGVE